MVDSYGGFAKENSACKAAFVIGVMTSVLAFASGGVVSGAAIGSLKLASNTPKGDKLSQQQLANRKRCGNWCGGRRIRRCFRQVIIHEITNTFINDASGEIDIAALDGMDATSLTDPDADAA